MRNRMIVIMQSVLIGVLMSVSYTVSVNAQGSARGQRDLPFKEEIRRSFQLAPGARVSVSTVSGPVDVLTTSGNTAEVFVVRSAETQRDLDCYRTVVEQTASGLSIHHEQQCRNINSHQRVHLSLPRDVNLRIESVSGDVHVGAIDGSANLSSISGGVWLAQTGGDTRINSVSGQVNLNVTRLGSGLKLDSISGRIMLGLADGLDAEVRAESISGHISSEIPGVTVEKVGDSDYRAQVGRGGAPVTINSVSGSITLRRF